MPVIPIPDDVYWPWRFIPQVAGSHTIVNDTKFQVNWRCRECVVLRNSIVSSRIWLEEEDPRSDNAKNSQLFDHHVDTHAMMQSAHGGCHLCSLLTIEISDQVRAVDIITRAFGLEFEKGRETKDPVGMMWRDIQKRT